jgi:putative oxidoreductase
MGARMDRVLIVLGRCLIALLFIAGALQKALDPAQVSDLLTGKGLPGWLVWPALVFNGAAALALILGIWLRWVAIALAIYCLFTSWFHFIPDDGWQMSIFIKNWAIAGGLLVLAGHAGRMAQIGADGQGAARSTDRALPLES